MRRTELSSNLGFRLMAFEYRLRDFHRPPDCALLQAGVGPGMSVLDFGCGPGGFSLAAARLVGPRGRVVAVDIHPLALRGLERAARRRGLGHLQVIHGDAMPQVPSGSVDVALLFDVLHEVEEPAMTLAEIRRVLKQDGTLCVADHCTKGAVLLEAVAAGGLFRLINDNETPLRFAPTKLSVMKT
jgi:ubiquinone/menaquinone biosynthesis C-methylase UbiE